MWKPGRTKGVDAADVKYGYDVNVDAPSVVTTSAERWRTTNAYGGDRADVTPPSGGTATSTVSDARGRNVQVRQYHGPTPTPSTPGSWDTTTL